MREIKFRIWCKQTEEMFEVEKMGFDDDGLWYAEDENGELYFADKNDSVLMQYTGLKDKNGREIYEGDIVDIHGEGYEVFYCESAARFVLKMKSGQMFISNSCRVVGNLYENPELLGE